jgi:plasmid replication initiation protein
MSAVQDVQKSSSSRQLSFLDSPLVGRVKNDRTVMVFNFFALTKDRVTELPVYDDGETRIEVRGTTSGVATIWDKELLIYLASLVQEKVNRGEPVSARMHFTAHDFFRICEKQVGGSAYEGLEEMLLRLQGTQVKTNIETGGEGEDGAFNWITDYRIHYTRAKNGEKRLKSITVAICDWLFRAIVKDQRMLTYDHGYFKLAPLERRLYEIARAHCGRQGCFRMGIEKLQRRVGSEMRLNLFKCRLLEVAGRPDSLLGYRLMVVDPQAPKAAAAPKRVPLKRLQVYFYRTDTPGHLLTPFALSPLVEE